MSKKSLRRILTPATVAALLVLTSASGNAAERTRWQPVASRSFEAPVGHRWGFRLLELLPHLWQKAVSQMEPEAEKVRSQMDPNGVDEKVRSQMDPNG